MKANARLTIQQQTRPESDFDEFPESWEDLRVERFVLTPLSSREYVAAQQIQSNTTHKAECPWFAGAKNDMRLVNADKTRIFNVESVVNRGERNRILDWQLVEVDG